MASSFPDIVVRRAWQRQAGRCAACGKELVRTNQDKGEWGAWHAHHRKPRADDGTDTLQNCAILCINNPQNCHQFIGHGGAWGNSNQLRDTELPFLYAGRPRQATGRRPTRKPIRRPMPRLGRIRT